MRKQIWGAVSQPDVFLITHEYVGKGRSERKTHAQAFNLLIINTGKEEKTVQYGVFEELGERLLSEVLERLVSTNLLIHYDLYRFLKGHRGKEASTSKEDME